MVSQVSPLVKVVATVSVTPVKNRIIAYIIEL